jgi:UrcA family protein
MQSLLFAAALAAAVAVPAASSESNGYGRTQVVRTADLDLRSRAGVRALDRRLRAATEVACGHPPSADLVAATQAKRCHSNARHSVAEQRHRILSGVLADGQ